MQHASCLRTPIAAPAALLIPYSLRKLPKCPDYLSSCVCRAVCLTYFVSLRSVPHLLRLHRQEHEFDHWLGQKSLRLSPAVRALPVRLGPRPQNLQAQPAALPAHQSVLVAHSTLDARMTGRTYHWMHISLSSVHNIMMYVSRRYTNMASNAMIVVCILILLQAAIQDDIEHPDAIQFFNSDKVETATLLLQSPFEFISHAHSLILKREWFGSFMNSSAPRRSLGRVWPPWRFHCRAARTRALGLYFQLCFSGLLDVSVLYTICCVLDVRVLNAIATC